MSWIRDKLLGLRAVFFAGEELHERGALEFAGDGVTVEDDPVNKRTKVTITGGDGEAGDVDPTPDTLALRGADGELKASRVIAEWTIRFHKVSADASPDAIMLPFPISDAPGFLWTVTRVEFIPNDYLVADDANYARLTLSTRNTTTGGHVGNVAIGVTKTSGSGATSDWTAFVPVTIPFRDGFGTLPIGANNYLALTIDKGDSGDGTVIPAGVLVVVCRPWAS
ncbi:hypothetical protein [Sorangium cellulosum]|uniref:Uncharacterized protein n=1 Tax=Sorangium cellulosum TaxID=56 RepID=A0A150Q9D5_SORCE|nr:hypothetical protein [Sorangium cellulosum]KYF64523.1 hypothetical protein BE15_04465 [Sorangium cellulosum]